MNPNIYILIIDKEFIGMIKFLILIKMISYFIC